MRPALTIFTQKTYLWLAQLFCRSQHPYRQVPTVHIFVVSALLEPLQAGPCVRRLGLEIKGPPDHLQADSSMRAEAAKAYALIREALEADPLLPLALHLDIHLSEAGSPLRSAAARLLTWMAYVDAVLCCG